MPRLVGCNQCRILQRIPDVTPGTPYRPARLQWTTGEDYIFLDDKGLPVMVAAYDPVLEDFVEKHTHGYDDDKVIGGLIQVWAVDQQTWDSIDVVTKIKKELQASTNHWYEERDEYREAAIACYNKHGNPDLGTGCPDYLSDDRRIGHGTYKTDDGGNVTVPPKFRQYLCYLCPYQYAYVNVELRRRKGYYK